MAAKASCGRRNPPALKSGNTGHYDLDLMLGHSPFQPLMPVEALKRAQNHAWLSKKLKRTFEENVACGMNSVLEGWPLQAETRLCKALQAFDDDRIKRVTGALKEVYYNGGLMGHVESLQPPIRLKGKDFVWHGELVGGMREFSRDDQVIPFKIHERIVYLREAGIRFPEYAMFVPGESFDPSKKELARQELGKMGKELVLAAKATGTAVKVTAKAVFDETKAVARTVGKAPGLFAGAFAAVPTAIAIPMALAAVPDPILCGVIRLSNPKTGGYVLINLGKWI